MSTEESPTAEQIIEDGIGDARGFGWSDESAASWIFAKLNDAGLLSEGAPSEERRGINLMRDLGFDESDPEVVKARADAAFEEQIERGKRAFYAEFWMLSDTGQKDDRDDTEKFTSAMRAALIAAGVAPQEPREFGESATVAAFPKAGKDREKLIADALEKVREIGEAGMAGEPLNSIPRDTDSNWGWLQTMWPVVVAIDTALAAGVTSQENPKCEHGIALSDLCQYADHVANVPQEPSVVVDDPRLHMPAPSPDREKLVDGLEVAMLGDTDGGLIDPTSEVPAGEMYRLAREYLEDALASQPVLDPEKVAEALEQAMRDEAMLFDNGDEEWIAESDPVECLPPLARALCEAAKRGELGSYDIEAEFIDIVLDGPPDHIAGRFVEVENPNGESIRVGRWIQRRNGQWALRIRRVDSIKIDEETLTRLIMGRTATSAAKRVLEYIQAQQHD